MLVPWPLCVPAGSAVFFTGMTVHGSYANHSGEVRAFAMHYMHEASFCTRCDLQGHVSCDEVANATLCARL
jgi:ectoine hydroxylase-related dioxygenase (phytanoyl-CoA dioxygenase family)